MIRIKQLTQAVIETHLDAENAAQPGIIHSVQSDQVWNRERWDRLHASIKKKVLRQTGESGARSASARWGRKVLRSYSSSFYAVTRFLPAAKRADVEIVYAAVRYPDEVVDTFDLTPELKSAAIEDWHDHFEDSASFTGIREMVENGIPVTVAGFRDVARRNGIPDRYYAAFLRSMRRDISPRPYATWRDLIENYIYGSASVVGYFLAHIYKPASGATMGQCLESARALAIALQLTNFARDVLDDSARGRSYLPLDQVDVDGKRVSDGVLAGDPASIEEAKLQLAEFAASWYEKAELGIQAFHPDSRIAIEACHRLYSRLNNKILSSESFTERCSLSVFEKLSVLPVSRYWRLPVAILFER